MGNPRLWWAHWLVALEFLTVLRLRQRGGPTLDRQAFAQAQALYPLIGLLIGLLAAGGWVLLDLVLPRPPADLLAVLLLVGLTGGLHIDGLGDTADGLLATRDLESRLAIMRDPRIGSYGAIVVAGALLLKWSALAGMTEQGDVLAALVVAPVAARTALVFVTGRYPYARADGMGAGFPAVARGTAGMVAAITGIVIGVTLYGPAGTLLVAGTAGAMTLFARWPNRVLGGLTGDVYGMLVEIAEVAVLLVVVAGAQNGWLQTLAWA